MAWSFLHYTCSPALAGESSPTNSLGSVQSELSKSTPTVVKCCCQDKLTDAFLTSLFGTMSGRSDATIPTPETSSTAVTTSATGSSSAVDSPAKTSPALDWARESTESVPDSGRSLPESLAKFDPSSRSWRTAINLFGEAWTLSLETWTSWGMMWRGEFFPLPTSARPTYESVFGELASDEMFPTPTVNMAKNAVTESQLKRKTIDLINYVAMYPTPCIHGVSGGSGNVRKIKAIQHLTLEEKLSMQAGNGGKINPEWVEWLMGWVIGWTTVRPEIFGTTGNTACRDSSNVVPTDVKN